MKKIKRLLPKVIQINPKKVVFLQLNLNLSAMADLFKP
jgi:hypothetical protein